MLIGKGKAKPTQELMLHENIKMIPTHKSKKPQENKMHLTFARLSVIPCGALSIPTVLSLNACPHKINKNHGNMEPEIIR